MRIDSRRIAFITLSLLLALWLPLSAFADGNGRSRKIVVFDSTIVNETAHDAIVRGVGGIVIKPLRMLNGVAVVLPETAERALSARPGVVRIDDDLAISATKKPSTAQPPQVIPWGIQRVNAPAAWSVHLRETYNDIDMDGHWDDNEAYTDSNHNSQYDAGEPFTDTDSDGHRDAREPFTDSAGNGVKVAVLDTGIQFDHPDLAANIGGGYNALNPRKSANDGNGHGTHVAGTIGAVDNSIGVVGVAPQVTLYAVKVLNDAGNGFLSDIIEGLDWCRSRNIRIVNMSLGASSDNQSFHDAISIAYASGIVLVAAAGNNGGGYGTGTGQVDYPAAYAEVIAVSATDQYDDFAVFSSFGPTVDLAAPGVDVRSTINGSNYATWSGTSMATPHVTGAAAVRLALHPTETPAQVKAALQSTAINLGLPSDQQGAGLVDAYAAALAP